MENMKTNTSGKWWQAIKEMLVHQKRVSSWDNWERSAQRVSTRNCIYHKSSIFWVPSIGEQGSVAKGLKTLIRDLGFETLSQRLRLGTQIAHTKSGACPETVGQLPFLQLPPASAHAAPYHITVGEWVEEAASSWKGRWACCPSEWWQ